MYVLLAQSEYNTPLDLAREAKEISESLKKLEERGWIDLRIKLGLTAEEFFQDLRELSGKISVLHFAGHSVDTYLEFLNGEFDTKGIAVNIDSIPLLVLNGCHNKGALDRFIRKKAMTLVVTNKVITDEAAITFSKSFYHALACGNTIQKSFEIATIQGISSRPISRQPARALSPAGFSGGAMENAYTLYPPSGVVRKWKLTRHWICQVAPIALMVTIVSLFFLAGMEILKYANREITPIIHLQDERGKPFHPDGMTPLKIRLFANGESHEAESNNEGTVIFPKIKVPKDGMTFEALSDIWELTFPDSVYRTSDWDHLGLRIRCHRNCRIYHGKLKLVLGHPKEECLHIVSLKVNESVMATDTAIAGGYYTLEAQCLDLGSIVEISADPIDKRCKIYVREIIDSCTNPHDFDL